MSGEPGTGAGGSLRRHMLAVEAAMRAYARGSARTWRSGGLPASCTTWLREAARRRTTILWSVSGNWRAGATLTMSSTP